MHVRELHSKNKIEEYNTCATVGMGTLGLGPHQVLAATLTLFRPGWADYAHHILLSPPSFESHRRAWPHTQSSLKLSFSGPTI